MNYINPFQDREIAKQWIKSVEGEKGMIRDNETYPALRNWFATTSKGIVVDIGSGQGICSSKIDGFERYIGVEPSVFLTERAKKLFHSPGIDFLAGDAYKLPLLDNSCDNVFSINVWFHLENLNLASDELARVLRRNGRFFIHTADSEALDLWKSFYINPSIDGKKISGEVALPINNMSMHVSYMHENNEVVEQLENSGLKVSRIAKLGKLHGNETIFIVIEGEKI